jgi:hypothetical protein
MPSEREQIAHNLADTCVFGGLNESYGVTCEKATNAKGKTYWSVTFAKARTLDGAIQVYSPTFILITWQTANRDLPSKGRVVAKSEGEAKELLQKFVNKD